MTSHTTRDREPDSASGLDTHHGPVFFKHKCTCSRVRGDYDAPSSLASLMPRNLERDTQYASGSGQIHLTDNALQFPRDTEEGLPAREEKSLGKILVFPRYWAWARLVQTFLSFFTMIIFSAYVDSQKYESKAIQYIWIVSALLSTLYSIGLATLYFGRSSRKLLLATFAPLIFAADVGSLSMQIVTVAVFPRNLDQLSVCYYFACGRGNMNFVKTMWAPTVSINLILYFASSCVALYITIVQMHLGTYNFGLRDFFEAYNARKAREQRVHDLVQRILDGSLDVVPVAPNSTAAGRHTAAPYQNPVPAGRGYVSAGVASVALLETRREAYHGPFERSSHSPAHICGPLTSGAPSTPREPPSSGPYSTPAPHSTCSAAWQPTAGPSTSSSPPSRQSKFVLTTEDAQTHAQSCCRRCGDIEPSPPSYLHAAVAALPQVPLQSTPSNSDDGEEDTADQSSENMGLLRPSERYM